MQMKIFLYNSRLRSSFSSTRLSSTIICHYYGLDSNIRRQVYTHTPMTSIRREIIDKIEKLSLINFEGDYSISVLKTAINFTECLRVAKINNAIEPMYRPFEKTLIPLRDDNVESSQLKEKILSNATVLEEEYFVAP
ncbi:glutamyl-tRNA(Gln) amidotransferase subunit C, mitochondrial [Ptiloglossa arizonensis]|uniref:glutamyl-tRNA(Gln) amidotransferase subunit C, mitochondrial n=1 Tax=Ptiloglossa arizonensis TaxID=3350558 RepID=UPI003F9EDA2D